jgi:hypothetical protein
MAKHPNGVWILRLSELRTDYLDRLVERRAGRVYLKVFDGRTEPAFWSFQCTPEIVQQFKTRGIEVYGWGLHYGTSDVDAQVSAVRQALDCGLDGYVLDLESQVEDVGTHPHVEAVLMALRPLVKPGTLGYSSFAHPGFHPDVPWRILDEHCDIALPQIYFELFTFRPTNEEEVQACLESQKGAGLTKPMLPVWSSSPDAPQPASASELQSYLGRFPGSSIWRLPHVGELGGQAWLLAYDPQALVATGSKQLSKLPILTRMLRRGDQGKDVKALQKALNERGFNAGPVDGDLGPRTQAAVKAFQKQAGITVDGIVGPETWGALGGSFHVDPAVGEAGLRLKLANLAQQEAAKNLRWTGPDCEAEKYLKPLRQPMRERKHIGTRVVFYNWCAAFVTWCCREAGIQIPDAPNGYWATMAYVGSWKFWAQKKGYWHPTGSITPRRGDILVFDWFDGVVSLDHIGIVSGYTAGQPVIHTYEGNSGNQTASKTRLLSTVPGFIRIMPE